MRTSNDGERAAPDQGDRYTIPAGVDCQVRRPGTRTWLPYTTKADVVVLGYLWRNEYCHGFLHDGWEIKVQNELFLPTSENQLPDF